MGLPVDGRGEHLSAGVAASLLSLLSVASMVIGPLFGYLVSARSEMRQGLVLGSVVASTTAWTSLLAWPGRAPLALVVAVMMASADSHSPPPTSGS